MEANFAVLGPGDRGVRGDAGLRRLPYDRWGGRLPNAITPQQKFGLNVFMGIDGGNCADCHSGSEFPGATVSARMDPLSFDGVLERMIMSDGRQAVYDGGFYNIGVRRTSDDIGLGANDLLGNLAAAGAPRARSPGQRRRRGILPPPAPDERVVADGAFKRALAAERRADRALLPQRRRRIALDVVQFYARGGDFHDQNIDNLDLRCTARAASSVTRCGRSRSPTSSPRSPTTGCAGTGAVRPPGAGRRQWRAGERGGVLQDLAFGFSADAIIRLPATGRGGATAALRPFLNQPLLNVNSFPRRSPPRPQLALFATDSITCASRLKLTATSGATAASA